jgi:hypothetical protein
MDTTTLTTGTQYDLMLESGEVVRVEIELNPNALWADEPAGRLVKVDLEGEQRDAYAALADEMNDVDVPPWNEGDWEPQAVELARAYALRHDLSFPPGTGDYDRFYERTRS